jgi:DNA polymerase III subunit epsilon
MSNLYFEDLQAKLKAIYRSRALLHDLGFKVPPHDVYREIASKPTFFFDTETTGVRDDDEVVEIAIIDVHGNVKIDTLVRPWKHIPDEATGVHGIGDADVADSPRWYEVRSKIAPFLSQGANLVGYNVDFDTRMMLNSRRIHNTKVKAKETEAPLIVPKGSCVPRCAMMIYTNYRGSRKATRSGKYKWYRLEDAARNMGIPVRGTHRALADTKMTLELLRRVAKTDDSNLLAKWRRLKKR